MHLRETTPDRIVSLRHQVLRPQRPVAECGSDTDREPGTFHIAVDHAGHLIGCAS